MVISFRHIVVLTSAAITGLLSYAAYDVSKQRAQTAFESVVADSKSALVRRLENYTLSLKGLSGFLEGSTQVTEADWDQYVRSLDIERTLPGVNGLGLIINVDASNLGTLLRSSRSDNSGELVIHPETGRPEKMVIRYISPIEANGPARGLDIAFEHFRRTAAELARDTGEPHITGPLTLVQGGTSESGMLLLLPWYKPGAVLDTQGDRRAALLGWVYAPLFGRDTLSFLTANQNSIFTMRVWDEEAFNNQSDYYNSHNKDIDSAHSVVRALPIFGRTWNISWNSTPAFDAAHRNYSYVAILAVGSFLTILLAQFLQRSEVRERRVERMVSQKTRELVASGELNRSIVENTVIGVVVLDAQNCILSANAVALDIFGCPLFRTVNRPIWDFVQADVTTGDWTFLIAQGRQNNEDPRHLEMQRNTWQTADGSTRHSVLLRDVTDAKNASEAMRETEERWNLALKGAEIGVFDIDLTTGKSVVSETWMRLMHVPKDAGITDMQSYFLSRIHPDDMPMLSKADRDCLNGLTPRSLSEFRVRFPDGSWRYMRSDAVVVGRDHHGRALRMVGAQTDIQVLKDAQDARYQSEERFRLVLSHAPVGMAVLDSEGRLSSANGALSLLTGRPADALHNLTVADLFDPSEAEQIVNAVDALHGNSEGTYRGEHKIIHQDGTIRWGLVRVSWIYDSASRAELFILQVNDMTQEKEASRVKSEFVATVSHELRTPLTSIKGAIGLLSASRDDMDSAGRRLLSIAASNTDRLVHLVNDILDLEKISSGMPDFNIGTYNAGDLARTAIEQNSPLAFRAGVTIAMTDDTEETSVNADPDRMAQVLSNLLSNAIKFAPRGSTVDLRVSTQGQNVLFDVIDRGPGVPTHFRHKIFQPFSQADSSNTRQKGGTGLGLNISKQIIEAMGGAIGFDKTPDNETRFWFTCPITRPADSQSPDTGVTLPNNEPAKKILHLARDPDFAEIVSLSIQQFAEVTTALSLSEARMAVVGTDFDALILDWALPDDKMSLLIDELVRLNPNVRIINLSTTGHKIPDARIALSLTKSRKGVGEIVEKIRLEMETSQAA